MATPNVAGAIALMLEQDPTNFPRPLVINTALHDAITNESIPGLGAQGWNGAGRVDAVAAIKAVAADAPPTASNLVATPPSALPGASVTFSVTASDSDGVVAEYLWDIDGDGYTDLFTKTNSVSLTVDPQAFLAQAYTAKVTVADNAGRTAIATGTWTVESSADGGTDASTDASVDAGDAGGMMGSGDASFDAGDDAAAEDSSVPQDSSVSDDSGASPDGAAVADTGAPPDSSGPVIDSGTPAADSGSGTPGDASTDSGTGSGSGNGGGCGCKVTGAPEGNTNAGVLSGLGLVVLAVRARRRKARTTASAS